MLVTPLAGVTSAQEPRNTPRTPDPVTLPFDHIHLAVPDPNQAVEFYQRWLNASAGQSPDRVRFGDVLVIFQRTARRRASEEGPVGHIAFTSPDIRATVTGLASGGARLVRAAAAGPGTFASAIVEDPWGTQIELVPGAAIALHHIHLQSRDPQRTLDEYGHLFGGERTRLDNGGDALRYGAILLQVERGEPHDEPTSIDHLSWRVSDVVQATDALRAQGVEVLREPGLSPGGNRVSFVSGPANVRIEIMQRPR